MTCLPYFHPLAWAAASCGTPVCAENNNTLQINKTLNRPDGLLSVFTAVVGGKVCKSMVTFCSIRCRRALKTAIAFKWGNAQRPRTGRPAQANIVSLSRMSEIPGGQKISSHFHRSQTNSNFLRKVNTDHVSRHKHATACVSWLWMDSPTITRLKKEC